MNIIKRKIVKKQYNCSSIWWTKSLCRIWHNLCSSDYSRSNSTQWHHYWISGEITHLLLLKLCKSK